MRRSAPNRSDALVDNAGRPTREFSATVENLVGDVNDLTSPAINTQTKSYTLLSGDRLVRRTKTNVQVVFSLSGRYEAGECIEVHNDSTNTLKIAGNLRHTSLGTGTRIIAPYGVAFLRNLGDVWKITGEGIS